MTDSQIAATQLKILVVDDDAFFRQLLNRILTAVGYLVMEARSVADAISALEQAPDLAIINYRMPGNDGASFIKELREKNYKFPIVFCSGSGIDQKTFASMRNVYQVDLIVQKPIQAEMFVHQIEQLLCARQNQQQEHSVAPIQEPILNEYNQTLDKFLLQDQRPCQSEEAAARAAAEEAARAIRETEQAIVELSCMYLFELPNELDQMTIEIQEAAIQKNTDALRQATSRAHQIKGTAGSLGFETLSKIGAALEKRLIALGQEELNGADYIWGEIFSSLTQARVWIKEKVEELDPGKSIETTVTALPLTASTVVESINLDQNSNSQSQDRLLPPRVLIVASDRELISSLINILEEERLMVTSLTSSMEAFSVLDDFQPELILLQATMPSVSGFDICRMIRCNSRWQTIPILILADIDSCTVESRQKVFEVGASDFVLTPLAPLELKAKLIYYLPMMPIQHQSMTV